MKAGHAQEVRSRQEQRACATGTIEVYSGANQEQIREESQACATGTIVLLLFILLVSLYISNSRMFGTLLYVVIIVYILVINLPL